jgi:hypothetical protein
MMAGTRDVPAGGYRCLPAVFQCSGGVAALPGFRIERARFAEPVPMAEGWGRIAAVLETAGRPRAAFCACELRSPAPFTEDGFRSFNGAYAAVLKDWGILLPDGTNPVARSNVCPGHAPPSEPGFHAFCYTVPDVGAALSFVVAGSGEAEEGHANYRDHIIAPGDTSAPGMLCKARWVLSEMEQRMAALGAAWHATTGVQAYTVHEIHRGLPEEIVARGAARHGLTWHDCRPPVHGRGYEMDCRGMPVERVLA